MDINMFMHSPFDKEENFLDTNIFAHFLAHVHISLASFFLRYLPRDRISGS
jgi:hypothetical protein